MTPSPLPKEQLDVVRGRYLDYLRERNLRQTQERLSVFEAVYDTAE